MHRPKKMESGGPSSRKRKFASLEAKGTEEAPASQAIVSPHPPGTCEDHGGVGEYGGADLLSSLPDAILGEIISLLATKEGARTRILASRWRDLWLSAPLNLDCRDLSAVFVSRILSSHHGPGRRFYVDTSSLVDPAYAVESCLRSTALDNLEELDFAVKSDVEQPHQALLVFRFSHTLRVANITGGDFSDITFQGLHFPLLKKLGLVKLTISECSLHTLIAACPALECLLIYHSFGFRNLRINSLTIRSVNVLSREDWQLRDLTRLKQLTIENAPCLLRLLILNPGDCPNVSVVAAPKLETLGSINDDICDDKGKFSKLVFGSTVIQRLHVDKLVTVVQSLKILAVDIENLSLDTVIQLLRCFPRLEKLYIQPLESRLRNFWRRKYRNMIRSLDMRLKTIVFSDYRGLKSEVNFIEFFVLNANLLESVTLGIRNRNIKEEFFAEQRMKLQIENGASKDVRLHFTTDTCVRNFYMVTDGRDYDLDDPFAHI